MTDQKILERAIQKAMDGGWLPPSGVTLITGRGSFMSPVVAKDWVKVITAVDDQAFRLIYSHDFAKALWSDELGHYVGGDSEPVEEWQHHLQMMVIAADPIKYLGEHLD